MTRVRGNWIRADHLQKVLGLLTAAGHAAYVVGGCVRNDLLGTAVSDIDIATDAEPLRVIELAGQQGLRVVPTGIDHGTVTVIADGTPHEVTTFRKDVETDGRRAVVHFSRNLAEDAARRDFTMNALYADAAGEVTDPVGGQADLAARRVRFIGDPSARITEDYLRILRFFRFLAWYGDPALGPDPEALAACAEHAEGIDRLSKERIGHEMRKLLSAPDPAPALAAMQAAGILARVISGADAKAIPVLVHLEDGTPPQWLARLAVLGGQEAGVALRLSRNEQDRLEAISAGARGGETAAVLGWRIGSRDGWSALQVRSALTGTAIPPGSAEELTRGTAATFPVVAADLMPALEGRALGQRMKEMERRWTDSDLRLSRTALLGQPDTRKQD